MPNRRKNLPILEIADLYKSGESSQSLAKKYKVSDATIRKHLKEFGIITRTLSESQSIWQKGTIRSEEHRKKISISKIGKPAPKPEGFGEYLRKRMLGKTGENHPAWRGGTTPIRNRILRLKEYAAWRTSVYERDKYTCQECKQIGGTLNAHHLEPAADILRKYNIETTDQAKNCIALWDVNNGLTLCHVCHCKLERRIGWQRKKLV